MLFGKDSRVIVKFPDNSVVRAVVMDMDDEGNYKCSVSQKTPKYKEGDTFICNERTHGIKKLGSIPVGKVHQFDKSKPDYDSLQKQYPNVDVFALLEEWEEQMSEHDRQQFAHSFNDFVRMSANTTINRLSKLKNITQLKRLLSEAQKFNWGFDIHKSPWKFDKVTGKIIKDEEAITKLAKKLKVAVDERNWLEKGWDKLWGVQTPEEYKAKQEKRYEDNPEQEFIDNQDDFGRDLTRLNKLLKTALDFGGGEDGFGDVPFGTEIPLQVRKEFPISGYLVVDEDGWRISAKLEGHTLAIGEYDETPLPRELVESWNLNSLLEGESKIAKLSKLLKESHKMEAVTYQSILKNLDNASSSVKLYNSTDDEGALGNARSILELTIKIIDKELKKDVQSKSPDQINIGDSARGMK